MTWYIGIDGGGTKTALAIAAADGVPVHSITCGGCSYQELGVENTVALIAGGVRQLLDKTGALPGQCGGCCIGLPCYGEDQAMDRLILRRLTEVLSPIPLLVVNDSVVGWAGSLGCRPGIHLVAGTGSIAFGRDDGGHTARCGGWTEFFGDEGSCYWVGREAMSLFSKQADGRLPRGPLYELVREGLSLTGDFAFIGRVLTDLAPHRDRVAAFQRYALAAADAGDASARALYVRAADELAALAAGVKAQLIWREEDVPVSYFGGLFHAGDWVLVPLREKLSALGCTLREPLYTATEGALLLAINHFNKEGCKCI